MVELKIDRIKRGMVAFVSKHELNTIKEHFGDSLKVKKLNEFSFVVRLKELPL
ncbi:hypothetical protein BpsS36_00002 [Bacillus phage vB_BpsS-36]|uniref:Uncharacterized protein n=1 Tax=Bacillus phage vB_BpsS-36 TaxID=2419622 RepID=A0A3G3BWX1_9CAUD|nr:hypothetical protein BpsS36_00002 [Bacillus phage vB_BpsS-36]